MIFLQTLLLFFGIQGRALECPDFFGPPQSNIVTFQTGTAKAFGILNELIESYDWLLLPMEGNSLPEDAELIVSNKGDISLKIFEPAHLPMWELILKKSDRNPIAVTEGRFGSVSLSFNRFLPTGKKISHDEIHIFDLGNPELKNHPEIKNIPAITNIDGGYEALQDLKLMTISWATETQTRVVNLTLSPKPDVDDEELVEQLTGTLRKMQDLLDPPETTPEQKKNTEKAIKRFRMLLQDTEQRYRPVKVTGPDNAEYKVELVNVEGYSHVLLKTGDKTNEKEMVFHVDLEKIDHVLVTTETTEEGTVFRKTEYEFGGIAYELFVRDEGNGNRTLRFLSPHRKQTLEFSVLFEPLPSRESMAAITQEFKDLIRKLSKEYTPGDISISGSSLGQLEVKLFSSKDYAGISVMPKYENAKPAIFVNIDIEHLSENFIIEKIESDSGITYRRSGLGWFVDDSELLHIRPDENGNQVVTLSRSSGEDSITATILFKPNPKSVETAVVLSEPALEAGAPLVDDRTVGNPDVKSILDAVSKEKVEAALPQTLAANRAIRQIFWDLTNDYLISVTDNEPPPTMKAEISAFKNSAYLEVGPHTYAFDIRRQRVGNIISGLHLVDDKLICRTQGLGYQIEMQLDKSPPSETVVMLVQIQTSINTKTHSLDTQNYSFKMTFNRKSAVQKIKDGIKRFFLLE